MSKLLIVDVVPLDGEEDGPRWARIKLTAKQIRTIRELSSIARANPAIVWIAAKPDFEPELLGYDQEAEEADHVLLHVSAGYFWWAIRMLDEGPSPFETRSLSLNALSDRGDFIDESWTENKEISA